MKYHCIAANNQVLNAMGMKGGQQIFEFLVHPDLVPGLSWSMRSG
jgi:hypothetical protein